MFLIATSDGPLERSGYTYRGLGLHRKSAGSANGRSNPIWTLTHLNSGHAIVAEIKGAIETVFPIAMEFADCCDWSFVGLDGWIKWDPELPGKVSQIVGRHPGIKLNCGTGHDEKMARRIAAKVST